MNLETTLKLSEVVESANIATLLSDKDLATIGHETCLGFEADLNSRAPWEKKMEDAMKLALQVTETKSFPWPNASNVKFPLITIAALQYHARAYPTLVNGDTPVKCRVIGEDADGSRTARATRIETHMSYQVMEEDEAWESEMDKVMITQPIIGCAFKKTYYDPIRKHMVSEFVPASDLVVNYYAKSMEDAQRITHLLYMSKNDVYERVARGLWIEMTEPLVNAPLQSGLKAIEGKSQGAVQPSEVDKTTPYEILEQHCYWDLDDDGYEEPYIVWVRKDTRQVVRIKANFVSSNVEYSEEKKKKVICIKAESYFTKYPFIPSPDGGFYDLGFGALLGPLNESINTIINQLVDCGTMQTTAGGFLSRGIKIRGGNYSFAPLEWKHVESTGDDLRKGIMPLPVREPSQVLFTLLNLLINYGERIGISVDILTGQNPGQNTPAETSRTMAEQGMKIFSGIFKRTYRSLRDEFRKIYRINQLFLPEKVTFFADSGNNGTVLWDDYKQDSKDIRPSADPNIVSDGQRVQQAMAVKEASMTSPGFNSYEVNKKYLMALRITDIEKVLPDPKGPNAIPQQPDIKLQIAQLDMQNAEADRQLEMKKLMMELMSEQQLNEAKIMELRTKAMLNLETAGSIQADGDVAVLQAQLGAQNAQKEYLYKVMDLLQRAHDNHEDRKVNAAKPVSSSKN